MTPEQIQRLEQHLRGSVAFSRHVGLRIEEIAPGHAVFSLDVEEVHMNGAGFLHGGVHATVMDSAMAVALIAHGLRVTTTQMNLNYIAAISSGRILCTGKAVHIGRRNAVAEAKMYDESGALVAVATASFRIAAREDEPGQEEPVNSRPIDPSPRLEDDV